MTDNYVPLGFTEGNVRSGSHIACVYQTDIDRVSIVLDYIAAGIRNNEKCIAAISEYSYDLWINGLRSRGINPKKFDRNQLEVISASRVTSGCRASSIMDTMPDAIISSIESSIRDGWKGIRLCIGFDSFLYDEYTAMSFLSAENNINLVSEDKSITALCTFSSSMLHPLMLDMCCSYHPYITYGSSVQSNAAYKEMVSDISRMLDMLRSEGAFEPPFTTIDFDCSIPVIHTGDELDLCTVPSMENMGERVIISGHRNIIVDLSDTTFMDASSLSALIRMTMAAERLGGKLVIYDPSDPLRKIFRIIGLNERIPVYRSIDDAKDAILSSTKVPDDTIDCYDDEDMLSRNLTLDL